jgi:hypothetical protein
MGGGAWIEDDEAPGGAGVDAVTPPPLGMAGPRAKQIRMSEESRAWVQSVTEKVRIASGERRVSSSAGAGVGAGFLGPSAFASGVLGGGAAGPAAGGLEASLMDRPAGANGVVFGEMGKVGSTKRVFRKAL